MRGSPGDQPCDGSPNPHLTFQKSRHLNFTLGREIKLFVEMSAREPKLHDTID